MVWTYSAYSSVKTGTLLIGFLVMLGGISGIMCSWSMFPSISFMVKGRSMEGTGPDCQWIEGFQLAD